MSVSPSPLRRALAVVAAASLAATGLVVGVAAPASATETVAFSTMPDTLAGNYASLGYQATSTDEFGDYIQLAGTDRTLTTLSVGMSSWACETGGGASCVTTPGATFSHPITMNIYAVDNSGAVPAVGALIDSVTEAKDIPFRPSADATCSGGTGWKNSAGACFNGYAFSLDFDFSGTVVPDDIIVSVAYNTNTHGAAPLGVSGPYESLNVVLAPNAPTVGTDETKDEIFWDTVAGFYTDGGAAGVDTLRVDTDWSDYNGLMLEVGVTGATAPASTTVTVYDRDVKPNETASTYLEWHEGKAAASPSNAAVFTDGLHLGLGARSTVIKGTDIPNSVVTKTQLLELITSASVKVTSGTVTFQVPVYFGPLASPSFTTLRSVDLGSGVSEFSQFDTWATTQAFGTYDAQDEAPLGELLDAIYAAAGTNGGVAVAGFGVQANTPAVVPTLTWAGTTYNFFQPEIAECTPTAGSTVTNLDSNGWSFAETRILGHNVFTADGLLVYTDAATSQGKAAGYVASNYALSDIGVPALNLGATSGPLPSIQLVTDFNNDGTTDGILVGETIYGDSYWVPDSAAQFVKDGAPSHAGGSGSANHGTLAEWLLAFPEARVLKVGYSLGSGVLGSAVIESIVVGCETITFEQATAPAATTQVDVTEHEIRPNEDTYPGWHEGYANAQRAYTVEDDGLHLGTGTRSQILFGFDAPLATTDLEAILTASSLNVVSGSVSFQFPVLYGPTNQFTTLRSESLSTTGDRGVSVTDVWVTTRAIYAADGTTVLVPAQTKLSVADFSALLGSIGNVQLIGYGVQADAAAVVESLTANGTKYTFTPYVAPPVTSTVRVPESDIRPDESTYPGWHEGYANASPSYQVTEDGLELGTPTKSQIINGFEAPLTSPSVGLLIAGAGVEVAEGSVTYQVPIFYGAGTDFLTLRSASLTAGSHSFDLTSPWASTRAVPALGITAHELVPLGDLLDKLTNVRVLAFGVQADAAATVTSIVFNQTEYQFDGPIEAGTPLVTGTPTVGQTLTAEVGTWAPDDVTFTYQWKSNGSAIAGATGSTYVLTGNEGYKTIVVEVTGTSPGYDSVSATSPGVTVAPGTLSTATPTITGEASIGSTLTANPGAWGPAPVELSYQWLADGVPVTGATGASYLITFSDAGKSLSVRVTGTKTGYTTASVTSAPTLSLPTDAIPVTERIFGDDRFETAVEIAQGFAPDVDRVYVATGLNYPDALSAAAAAAHLDAPLLLTRTNELPEIVADELERLSPTEIIVVGSSAAVSAGVFSALEEFADDVTRLGGIDRYATSRLVSAEAFGSATTAYIATGTNFPDALAAGPAAAHFDGPVILVPGMSNAVDAATIDLLDDLGVTDVKIAGNSLAVSSGISAQLSTEGFTVKRNQGTDRFKTAVAINLDAFESAETVYLATGLNFPDALAGGARAGFEDAPLFVTLPNCIPEVVMEAIIGLSPATVVLLGGLPSLSAEVEDLDVCS